MTCNYKVGDTVIRKPGYMGSAWNNWCVDHKTDPRGLFKVVRLDLSREIVLLEGLGALPFLPDRFVFATDKDFDLGDLL